MKKTSIGIYINSEKPTSTYDAIKTSFKDYVDLVIFSDILSSCTNIEYAVLPSFYMYFFNHPIVFLDDKHIEIMTSKMISQDIYTIITGELHRYEI